MIGKEDLEKKDYKNIEEILRDTPNVMVQETYFGNGERAISRVKVLVDGVAINPIDESMGTLPINTILVSSIERIEIIPGGGAVLNGSGTAGGVVNIITKSTARKNDDRENGSFTAGFPVESKSDRESYVLDHEFKVNDNFTLLTTRNYYISGKITL